MVRNKTAAAMAAAALMVAAYGGVAGAEDTGGRNPSSERMNVTVICSQFGGTVWADTDGNGTMDYHATFSCGFIRGIWHL